MTKPATFIVNTENLEKLKAIAEARDLSLSAVVRLAIGEYLKRNQKSQ